MSWFSGTEVNLSHYHPPLVSLSLSLSLSLYMCVCCRIPQAGDSVAIAQSGTYTVYVDTDASVSSMSVGSGTRSVTLVVESGMTLNVAGQLNFIAPNFTVLGAVNTSSLAWSGQYISGPSASGAARGSITVHSLFLIRRGSYSTKYFTDVDIDSKQNLTLDSSLDSSSNYINFGRSTITNRAGATMRMSSTTRWSRYGTYPTEDPSDGFRQGFINYGTLVIEQGTYSSNYFYLDLRNFGRTIIVTIRYTSNYQFTVYTGRWINSGKIDIYMSNLRVYRAPFTGNGTITLYPKPVITRAPTGNGKYGMWKAYLDDLFANASMFNNQPQYDLSYYATLTLYYMGPSYPFTTGSLVGNGRSIVEFYSTTNSYINVTRSLKLSDSSNVRLLSNSRNCTLITPPYTTSELGFVSSSVKIGEYSTARFYRNVIFTAGTRLDSNYTTLLFFDDVVIAADAEVRVELSTVSFGGNLDLQGTLNCTESLVTAWDTFRWTSGRLLGQNTTLRLKRAASISGQSQKSLTAMNIAIEYQLPPAAGRVLAEYFNTSGKSYFPGERISSSALPASFDNSSTPADRVRFENRLQQKARYNGYGPLRFSSPDTLNYSGSYTSGSAARVWFFLQIDTTGDYRFYVNNGYVKVRLTVADNASVIFPYRSLTSSGDFNTSSIFLKKGLIRVHYDYITTSYWSTQQRVRLLYDGPGFNKTTIPLTKIFAYRSNADGTVEFANMNSSLASVNNAALNFSDGTLFGKSQPVLNVTTTGVLSVQSDVTLVGVGVNSSAFLIINSGVIRRELGTPGVATFYATVQQNGGQTQILTNGLQFSSLNADGGVVLWDNAAGGSWTNLNNWNPRKVPLPDDLVYINEPGDYKVYVPGQTNVTVRSLFVGAEGSNPNLVVGFFSSLTVQNQLDITASTITINGQIDAENINWAGQYLNGGGQASSLIARKSLTILRGSSSTTSKYLFNMRLENRGNASVETAIKTATLFCSNCQVINSNTATFMMDSMRFTSLTSSCQSPGAQVCTKPGFINYGRLVLQYVKTYSTFYWTGFVYNYQGTMYIINKSPSYYMEVRFSRGNLHNEGQIECYQARVTVYFVSSSSPTLAVGNVLLYNRPASYSQLPGRDTYGSWEAYIAGFVKLGQDVSQNQYVFLRLRNFYGTFSQPVKISVGNVTGVGRGLFEMYNPRFVQLNITKRLWLDKNFYFRLLDAKTYPSTMTISSAHQNMLGVTEVYRGWTLKIADNGRATFGHRLFLAANSQMECGKKVAVVYQNAVVIQSDAVLRADTGNLTMNRQFLSAGTVDFGRAAVKMYGRWQWPGGTVQGNATNITVQGGLQIYGTSDKIAQDVNFELGLSDQLANTASSQPGVVVEYFQYRAKNAISPQLPSYISSFPSTTSSSTSSSVIPASFNDPNTQANYYEIKPSVSQQPLLNGNAPLQYLTTSVSTYNSSDPLTFTSGYGMRKWSYVNVPATGSYTFYAQSGYALRYRLWVDDSLFWSPSWSGYYFFSSSDRSSQSLSLTKGYHRIRVDLYVTSSSSWSTNGNGFVLKWSGPGFNKTEIPASALFAKITPSEGAPMSAQPALNNASNTAWRAQYNAQLAGSGRVTAKKAVNLIIKAGTTLDVQSDTTWQCTNPSTCAVRNFGTIRRSGTAGPALLYASYVNSSSSKIDVQVSSLEIRSIGSTSSLITWNAAVSGVWTNASNWAAGKLPGPNDTAYITVGGNYTVFIPTGVTIKIARLVVGKSGGGMQLQVGHFSKLVVTDRLDIRSPNFTIQGSVEAKDFLFTGNTISGSTKSFAASKLTITNTFSIGLGSSTTKYFTNVVVDNFGTMSFDGTLADTAGRLYITNGQIIIHPGATWILSGQSFSRGSGSTKFEYDVVNHGTFVVTPYRNYNNMYYYWNTDNRGRLVTMPLTTSATFSAYFYNMLMNQGVVDSYMPNTYLYNSYTNTKPVSMNGTWNSYGQPYVRSTVNLQRSKWQEFLNASYNATKLYSTSYSFIRMNSISNKDVDFGTMNFYGRTGFEMRYARNSTIRMSGGMTQGKDAKIVTQTCYAQPCRIVIGNDSLTAPQSIGFVYLINNYNITINGKVINFNAGVSLDSGASLTVSPTQNTTFMLRSPIAVKASATLTIDSGKAFFKDSFTLASGGVLRTHGSSLYFEKDFAMSDGSVIGPGKLLLQRSSQLTSANIKKFTNIDLVLQPASFPLRGVIAEYFQYRVATSTTSQRSLYYFPPSSPTTSTSYLPPSFNDPLTKPNFVQIETSLSRPTRYYGSGPLALQAGSSNYDTTSAQSYTFNYAVRLWTYLTISASGNYTFYLKSGYSVKPRLWIDSSVVYTASSFRYIYSAEVTAATVTLSKGLHLIRLDYLVRSSSWDSVGSGLILKYSGPFVPKQEIPSMQLLPMISGQTQLTASPSLNLSSVSACSQSSRSDYPLSYSRLLVSDAGLVSQANVTVLIEQRGELELQTSTSWPNTGSSQRTKLFIGGLLSRTGGAGTLSLNTEFNTTTGCVRVNIGALDLGISSGESFWIEEDLSQALV